MRTIEESIQAMREKTLNKNKWARNLRSTLTGPEIIALHRHMWKWIADESETRKEYMSKKDYMEKQGIGMGYIIHDCFACLYTVDEDGSRNCRKCPLEWPVEQGMVPENQNYKCTYPGSPYGKIEDAMLDEHPEEYMTLEEYVDLARQIANLPLSETAEEDMKNETP